MKKKCETWVVGKRGGGVGGKEVMYVYVCLREAMSEKQSGERERGRGKR